jgi:hypothetical protein
MRSARNSSGLRRVGPALNQASRNVSWRSGPRCWSTKAPHLTPATARRAASLLKGLIRRQNYWLGHASKSWPRTVARLAPSDRRVAVLLAGSLLFLNGPRSGPPFGYGSVASYYFFPNFLVPRKVDGPGNSKCVLGSWDSKSRRKRGLASDGPRAAS